MICSLEANCIDLHGLADMKFPFELGKPFTPFQQLMGVLPEDSKEHVPSAYRVSPASQRRLIS